MPCPRRAENEPGPWQYPQGEGLDGFERGHGLVGQSDPACTYCGSLSGDRFMELVHEGAEVGPTDKSYKAYVGGQAKFYFQHLSDAQKLEFVELLNAGKVQIGYPGHFYVPPFFVRYGTAGDS
ncbi:MAG TPA: hypothetical protein VGJ13_05400 [Pseudonocardiaceae bacterium]